MGPLADRAINHHQLTHILCREQADEPAIPDDGHRMALAVLQLLNSGGQWLVRTCRNKPTLHDLGDGRVRTRL